MSHRLIPQSLLRWLHRYDDEFRELVLENQRCQAERSDAQEQVIGLKKELATARNELAEAEQDAAVAAAYREQLQRNVSDTTALGEKLKRQYEALAEEIRREKWSTDVLSDDFIAGRIAPQRKHAWLVAAPKCGSTWLTALLSQLLGWQPHMLTAAWDRREQEVDLRRMLEFPHENLFSIQQHCRYSQPTRDFLRKFRVQVILQGRNICDSVVSLRDHFLRESPVSPICFVYDGFSALEPERQLDMVIDLAVPWYLSFYSSWFTAKQSGEADFLWIDYESLCRDAPAELRRVAAYLDLPRSDAEIEDALNKATGKPLRLNVGRTGRGAELLSQRQKDRIAQLRSYYPQVDFSAVGL